MGEGKKKANDIVLVLPQTKCLRNVCSILRCFGMDVFQTEDIKSVKAGLSLHSPAFILLDGDKEETESFLMDVSRQRLFPPPYIIVVGTFPCREDRIVMLNTGADICIDKPVNAEEILAVVRAVFRRERRLARLHGGKLLPRIEHKQLVIDPLCRTVTMNGGQVSLTAKEFDILYYLAFRAGTVLTQEEIFEAVWKEPYNKSSTGVPDHISSLRRKLGLHKRDKDYIETVFGVGYRFAKTILDKTAEMP